MITVKSLCALQDPPPCPLSPARRGHPTKSAPHYPDDIRTAVVVPGSTLARTRERLVSEAERVALRACAELVVFSGRDEAEHMRSLWRGPDVDLLVDETATTTAENAARTLPLLVERDVREAVVVCAPAHAPRAGWIFRRIYGAHGIRVKVRPARVIPTPAALVYELGAATIARRQVREHR